MSYAYRTVTVEVKSVRDKSIVVQVPKRQGTNVIARSLINGIDDRKLDLHKNLLPREMTFRVFAWKAEELSLA